MSRPMFINVGKVQYPLGIDQERYRPQVGPTETSPVLIFIGFVHKDIKNTFGNPCWKFGSRELCSLLWFCNIQRKIVTATILQHTWKNKTKSVHIIVFNIALKVPYQNWLSANNLLIGELLQRFRFFSKHNYILPCFLSFSDLAQ